ncbi:hypothetical protein D515_04021 [Grimontia indica]|uniref:Uncharacterized protein n=1 Tax=Grimontia indica TaxID=1056512 RepID=R1IPM4_9GAMM|nr:hypothetical protein D515_04021 [Grimontia indica]
MSLLISSAKDPWDSKYKLRAENTLIELFVLMFIIYLLKEISNQE